MKKKIIIVSILCVLCIGLISGILFLDNKNVVLENEKTKKSKNNNQISMMFETAKDSNVYEASSDNTFPTSGYVFNKTLSKCENGGTISWDSSKQKAIVKNNTSDKCYAYFDVAPDEIKLADYIKGLYTSQGTNNLYLHDSTLANGAGDNSYRYAGSSDTTNNFVCFGYDSTDGTCPTDYLYRIIGVFDDQVKLIKYDYAQETLLGNNGDYSTKTYTKSKYTTYLGELSTIATFYWNSDTENTLWNESALNTVNLNVNFLNNIGTRWSNIISTHVWKIGGNTENNIASVDVLTAYSSEITNPAGDATYQSKIGLMYVSDYGYAALPSAWSTTLDNYNDAIIINSNWMYMGLHEWTITPNSRYTDSTFYISYHGDVSNRDSNMYSAIRPVFYLTSDTVYSGGNGTASTPYLIN